MNLRPDREHSARVIEAEVKDLAFNGKSIGDVGGKIVFLNAGLPGELVRAEIIRKKPRYDVAQVTEIIRKSPQRVSAPCQHFDICGGCVWQDLEYSEQLRYKRKQVVDCLQHIGRLGAIDVGDAVGVENPFFYRNKMEYSFNRDREGGFVLGLHRRGHFDRIFNVEQCLLQSEESNQIVNWFRDYVAKNDIPVYDVTDHNGFLRFFVIREGKNTGQVMLNIVTVPGEFPEVARLIDGILARFPRITTVVQNINAAKSNIARGEEERILHGNGFMEERVLGRSFRIYANSFFQTNTVQAEKLYSTAIEFLGLNSEDHLLDLYCGTGSIGICASEKAGRVTGIELELSAIKAARQNAEINGIGNIEFIAGSVQDFLIEEKELLSTVTMALIDPPRAGLHPKALKGLMALRLPRLVYVSCNPATFARDAAELVQAGYKLLWITPIDMFPHTMHIELVARFELS